MVHDKKVEKIVVLGTGGTIAGTAASADDHTGYTAAQLSLQDLMHALPGMARALHGRECVLDPVAQLDSKDMDHATWHALALRCQHWLAQTDVAGLVITHGTDTLEETAWFLQQVLPTSKPVVLTCAMRPATALGADGPQNLLDALSVAGHGQRQGVVVVCAGVVHAAEHVYKAHTYRLDAFSSGESGPLGWVEQSGVRWASLCVASPLRPDTVSLQGRALPEDVATWPQVGLVYSHAGASRAAVDALVAAGVHGLVVAGTGNGTLHQVLEAALTDAQAQGVAVRRVSRCTLGQIVGDSGGAAKGAGAIPCAPAGLSAVKARISLMLELMAA